MKPETLGHIEAAGRNREIAWQLFSNSRQPGLTVRPFEWVAVVTFYSAVHYANAYIWELHGRKVRHPQRRQFIAAHPPLMGHLADYVQVEAHAWAARYTPGHRLSAQDARELLTQNLALFQTTICRELGIIPP